MKRTAILVDGGFYRKQALYHFGKKRPDERVTELIKYCKLHLKERSKFEIIDKNGKKKRRYQWNELYRIFYYDCPPISKALYHPLTKKNIDFSKTDTNKWMVEFIEQLIHQRKVALRMGTLADSTAYYGLKNNTVKKLFSERLSISDITENDFDLVLRQKGVDMKIGIDIATLAYKKLTDQIILITGDSDFVPAAKLARREGIDFIVDPMGHKILPDLMEHIDGLQSYYKHVALKNSALQC
ncbi:NYN domain-containing protein [Treponema sp. OMZ 799]|uniref:NYN domain-containing protein n=2 Tax=Treponema TaxID=157 RepID=UPI0020A3E902|nr:NYN domain-containing protein [Treponema sp. OMZ 799]UTC78464.1 NYN domain-containing protein [Treponema sp. OMZ 799]